MIITIDGGGGGAYANSGSCVAVTEYLQHEDLERMQQGQQPEPFFNQERARITHKEVTYKIDHNRAQLHKEDAKFFVITVCPSEKELAAMGATKEEQAAAMKEYIRNDVMQQYAEGFGKGLNAKDIEYYGKIHFERNGKAGENLHAHIIVSRKDRSNTIKLSPKTNHKRAGKGAVKSGFDRSGFFQRCEQHFDKRTGYDRDIKESYEYRNAMKNGTPKEMQEQVNRAIQQERQREQQQRQQPEQEIKQSIEIKQEQRKKRGLKL